jgi:phenylpyruvate tautomerase PptA (4-oxalocrotonate tautomerase family)
VPITVTAPHGVLTPDGRRAIVPALTQALAEATDATDRPEIVATIGGTVQLLDPADVYAGGRPHPLVLVELKLPAVALTTLERRARFIAAATRIVGDLTTDDHADADTWVNILHAQDGAWGIGGRSLTNEMLSSGPTEGDVTP